MQMELISNVLQFAVDVYKRQSYSIANPIMREGEAPQRTVSQETCLIREMGFRVKHRIQQGKKFSFRCQLMG